MAVIKKDGNICNRKARLLALTVIIILVLSLLVSNLFQAITFDDQGASADDIISSNNNNSLVWSNGEDTVFLTQLMNPSISSTKGNYISSKIRPLRMDKDYPNYSRSKQSRETEFYRNVTSLLLESAKYKSTKSTTTRFSRKNDSLFIINNKNEEKNDVCLKGWWGRTFNRMITLAKALYYTQLTHASALRVDSGWMEFIHEWFDNDNFILNASSSSSSPKILSMDNDTNSVTCRHVDKARAHFDHSMLYSINVSKPSGYNPAFDLLPPLKRQYMQEACAALGFYKQQHLTQLLERGKQAQPKQQGGGGNFAATKSGNPNIPNRANVAEDLIIVTVHLRWMEGTCRKHAHKKQVFCHGGVKEGWAFACGYTEPWVRRHLRRHQETSSHTKNGTASKTLITARTKRTTVDNSDNDDNVLVILLGDGEHAQAENTFTVKDNHTFAVQVAMMVLSDVHFGNPVSSVDYVVAHWRRGKPQEPELCYQAIVSAMAKG